MVVVFYECCSPFAAASSCCCCCCCKAAFLFIDDKVTCVLCSSGCLYKFFFLLLLLLSTWCRKAKGVDASTPSCMAVVTIMMRAIIIIIRMIRPEQGTVQLPAAGTKRLLLLLLLQYYFFFSGACDFEYILLCSPTKIQGLSLSLSPFISLRDLTRDKLLSVAHPLKLTLYFFKHPESIELTLINRADCEISRSRDSPHSIIIFWNLLSTQCHSINRESFSFLLRCRYTLPNQSIYFWSKTDLKRWIKLGMTTTTATTTE